MAQRKQLTWTELRVGLFVLVGLSVLAAGIFYVTGAGTIGPKYRLITYLSGRFGPGARSSGAIERSGNRKRRIH